MFLKRTGEFSLTGGFHGFSMRTKGIPSGNIFGVFDDVSVVQGGVMFYARAGRNVLFFEPTPVGAYVQRTAPPVTVFDGALGTPSSIQGHFGKR